MVGNKRCVITQMPYKDTKYDVLTILDEKGRAEELFCQPVDRPSFVGNIYTGRVERILDGIHGAFVRITKDQTVYLPMEDAKDCIYSHKYSKGNDLCCGDEILVQVVKDAIKTKEPVATCNLSFSTDHVLLTTANREKGVSKKLDADARRQWKAFLDQLPKDVCPYGIVIRTGAAGTAEEELMSEICCLKEQADAMISRGSHSCAYTLLHSGESSFLQRAKKFLTLEEGFVQTDLPDIFSKLLAGGFQEIRLYEDSSYELYKLIGLPTILDRALARQIWLPSGASLVIEPTEALTVIDVNSGKKAKKRSEDYYLGINLEAAEEIARQLRLRNISGIIVVDFINMKSEEQKQAVLKRLREAAGKDPVPVQILDYTRLQLVEITRKKQYASLRQQMGMY